MSYLIKQQKIVRVLFVRWRDFFVIVLLTVASFIIMNLNTLINYIEEKIKK